MPSPKRWHPVSRDLNDDAQLWELTDKFGDRAIRVWLEILAILDRVDNCWRMEGSWESGLVRKCRLKRKTIRQVIQYLVVTHWVLITEDPHDGYTSIMSARNYWKFHKMRESKGDKQVPPLNLPYPNQEKKLGVGAVDTVNIGDKEMRIVSKVVRN